MHEDEAEGTTGSASQAAAEAWRERSRDPKVAVGLSRNALNGGAEGTVAGVALAARAVASLALDEPAEALAAARRALEVLPEPDTPAGPAPREGAAGRGLAGAGAAGGGAPATVPPGQEPDLCQVVVEARLTAVRSSFLLEDPVGAVRFGREALALAERCGLTKLAARAHSDLAAVYGSRELLDVALRHLTSGIALLEAAGLPVAPALLNNLGNVYLGTSRLDEALACFTRAREGFQAASDPFGAALARSNEGRALVQQRRFSRGIEALQESLDMLSRAGNRTYHAATLAKIAQAHSAAGDDHRAALTFEKAVASLRADHDPWEAEVRGSYGEFLLGVGRPEEALRELEHACRLHRAAGADIPAAGMERAQAEALAALGRHAEAYERLAAYLTERERSAAERSDLLLRMLLVEMEAGLGSKHELHVVARQAVAEANRALREHAAKLEGLSITDDLTELFNRRYFRRRLQEEESRAQRDGNEVVVLLVDIDHFKLVNDLYSHTVGDAVLSTVAGILRRNCRASDVVARWGGEEFAILMPGTTSATAYEVAERGRRAVAEHPWRDLAPAAAPGLSLTVSVGLASTSEVSAGSVEERLAELLKLVDERLYRAKRGGRNRTVASGDGLSEPPAP